MLHRHCFGVHLLKATLALNNTRVQREQVMEKENYLNPCLLLMHLVFTSHATLFCLQTCPNPPAYDSQTSVQSVGGAGELLL